MTAAASQPALDQDLAAEILDLWREYRRTRRARPHSRAQLARLRHDLALSLRRLHTRTQSLVHFRRCLRARGIALSSAYRLMALVENSQTTCENAAPTFPREKLSAPSAPPPPAAASPRYQRRDGLLIFHFDPREAAVVRCALVAHHAPGLAPFDLAQRFCGALLRRAGLGPTLP